MLDARPVGRVFNGMYHGATMAKQFRVFFAPEDAARIERLKHRLGITNVLGVILVCLERCMTRYPDPESITKAFTNRCESAKAELSDGAVSHGQPQGLRLGDRYVDYVKSMKGPLGFEHGSKMVRSVLILFECGDI